MIIDNFTFEFGKIIIIHLGWSVVVNSLLTGQQTTEFHSSRYRKSIHTHVPEGAS